MHDKIETLPRIESNGSRRGDIRQHCCACSTRIDPSRCLMEHDQCSRYRSFGMERGEISGISEERGASLGNTGSNFRTRK